jgi:YVTN family beta-propeller protein
VAQFKYFEALDGEATVKVYNEAKGHHAKKVKSATIAINGKKIIGHRDFYKKKFFRFWNFRKKKYFRCSYVKQPDDYIEKTVELTKGQNSLEVMLNSRRGGKIRVVVMGQKFLEPDDDGDGILMSYETPCTGGNTNLCNDNCPNDFNPDQADSDGDGIGDVCDDTEEYPYFVKTTIDVGNAPWGGIAVSPDDEFVYVTNFSDNNVSVISTSDNMVHDTIDVGNGPTGVAMSPGGAVLYVSNYYSNSVSVIDIANNSRLDIPVGNNPFGISVTPDGSQVYVCNYGYNSNKVSVINTANNSVLEITVGNRPYGVSVTSDGAYAYVSNRDSSTVSVIRTSDNAVLLPAIFVGGAPSGITVTPDGDHVYVNHFTSGTVSVIDTSDNNVIDIPVVNEADGIAVTPTGAYVYVYHHNVGTVSIIRTSDNTLIDTDPNTVEIEPTIQVGIQPYAGGMAVSHDGKLVYVGDYTDGIVSVIGF